MAARGVFDERGRYASEDERTNWSSARTSRSWSSSFWLLIGGLGVCWADPGGGPPRIGEGSRVQLDDRRLKDTLVYDVADYE